MLKVLIVENNRVFREAFKSDLGRRFPSMVIEEAGDSGEALKKIDGDPPHLIFMDIRLPGMNGLQLTQRIKKDFPSIPVAILTSYDLPEYREAALQYGADRFFVKDTFRWDEVEALVKSIQAV